MSLPHPSSPNITQAANFTCSTRPVQVKARHVHQSHNQLVLPKVLRQLGHYIRGLAMPEMRVWTAMWQAGYYEAG